MRYESFLFCGIALFFAITAVIYGWFSREPAGLAALIVSFLMSSLIAFFLWTQHVRRGERLQDRKDAQTYEASGPLAFFPARSYTPPLTAAGAALTGLGVVFGIWLFFIGVGVLVAGVAGFVFQYNNREA
ncbi:cytochrome c oxidase subunit 4 [Streptomyces sp. NPDC051320]|uniref:aa3-type cytochrome oxidase subunit IV n=1 Tax=Streptomyces sp. NPDC051320 TaxID=3154644 RepID=UPI00342A2011